MPEYVSGFRVPEDDDTYDLVADLRRLAEAIADHVPFEVDPDDPDVLIAHIPHSSVTEDPDDSDVLVITV